MSSLSWIVILGRDSGVSEEQIDRYISSLDSSDDLIVAGTAEELSFLDSDRFSRDVRCKLILCGERDSFLTRMCMASSAISGDYAVFAPTIGVKMLGEGLRVLKNALDDATEDVVRFGITLVSYPDQEHSWVKRCYGSSFESTALPIDAVASAYAAGCHDWLLNDKAISAKSVRGFAEFIQDFPIETNCDLLAFPLLLAFSGGVEARCDEVVFEWSIKADPIQQHRVPLSAFSMFCRTAIDASRALERLDFIDGLSESRKRIIDCFRNDVERYCGHMMRYSLADADKCGAYETMVSSLGIENALSSLSGPYWYLPGELAKHIAQSADLYPSVQSIKVIGLYYFALEGGGAESVLLYQAKLWARLGIDVVLFVEQLPGDDIALPGNVSIEVVQSHKDCTPETYARRANQLRSIAAAHRVDVILYHSWLSHLLLWDMLLFKDMGIPFIVHCHGECTHQLRHNTIQFSQTPFVFRLCDALIILNEADYSFWNMFNDRVLLVRNPLVVDKKAGFKNDQDTNMPHVLWVGRFDIVKHPEDAIKIASCLKRRGESARFFMVGASRDGEYEKRLREMASKYDVEEMLCMEGWQSDVTPYLENADVYLMTSETEGYPLTLLEAKSAGLPCVSYEIESIVLLNDARGVISVPQGDYEAAADAIVTLLHDDGTMSRMRFEAGESAQDAISFDYAQFWQSVFDRLKTPRSVDGFSPIEPLWTRLFFNYACGIDAKNATLSKMRSNIRGLSSENAELRSSVETMREEHENALKSLSKMETKLEKTRRKLARAEAKTLKAREELADLKQSHTWKAGRFVLAPLRKVKRWTKSKRE